MAGYVIHHLALSCSDPIALERWYTKHFGFARKRVYLPGPDQVVVIGNGGVSLELFPAKGERPSAPEGDGAGPEYPGFRHLAFLVDDLDAKLADLGEEAPLTLGPLDMGDLIPGMRVAWVSDPDGNIVELNQGFVDEESPPPLGSDS
jgi:glyoxylase I family protein